MTKAQTQQIKAVFLWHAVHGYVICSTLASCREEMSRKFFLHISEPTSWLHHLLPDPI